MNSPNFSTLPARQQIQNPLLQTVMIIIVIVLFGWFVLGPKYTKTQQTSEQLEVLAAQRASLESDQIELNKLISQLENSEEEIKLLDEAVPLTARHTRIAMLLESYAQNTGIVLSQLSVGQPEKFIASGNKDELAKPFQSPRQLAVIEISASVKGSIDQFKNFLTLLEQSGRIIDVSSLTVTSTEEGPNYNIRLKTYAYELAQVTTPQLGEAE